VSLHEAIVEHALARGAKDRNGLRSGCRTTRRPRWARRLDPVL